MHLVGLHFTFSTQHLLLQIFMLFVINLLAMMVLLIVSKRCAVFWFKNLFSISLAHFSEMMFFESKSLALQISSWCLSLFGSMVRGALNAMMLKVLGQNQVFVSIDSLILH